MARRVAGGSWFAALLGLSLLALLAFLVGAFAGLVWKEPGLLVAYLRGDTTELAWSTASQQVSPAGAPPAVAAAPETAAPRATSAPPAAVAARPDPPKAAPKPAKAKPAPRPTPAVATAPSGGHIAVQVGAFSDRAVAEKLRERLHGAGYPAYLVAAARGGDHWRVRVGPYASREQAGPVALRLERDQKLPIWVLDEDAE